MLSLRVHTHSIGKDIDVRLDVGFKLHPKGYKPKYSPEGAGRAWRTIDIDIPAGEDNVRLDAYTVLKTPAKFMTFEPHMHASGKRMCVQAIYPSGVRETLNCAGLQPQLGEGLQLRRRRGAAAAGGHDPARHRLVRQLGQESRETPSRETGRASATARSTT